METVLNDTSYGLLTWQVIILVSIGLWIYSLIDILKSSFEKNNKIIWILVVLLVPILGSVLYIFIGRKLKLKLN
jgi:hypothetical protein